MPIKEPMIGYGKYSTTLLSHLWSHYTIKLQNICNGFALSQLQLWPCLYPNSYNIPTLEIMFHTILQHSPGNVPISKTYTLFH